MLRARIALVAESVTVRREIRERESAPEGEPTLISVTLLQD